MPMITLATSPFILRYSVHNHFTRRPKQTLVSAQAMRLTNPQLTMTTLSPHSLAAGANTLAPTNAPNFPAAALIPFKVDRHSSEYVTEGSKNVVEFGP